jgi:hypothetical protein
MSKLPKKLALLGGIVAFCLVQLLSMLRGVAPLGSLKRALVSAVVVAAMTGLCARIAAGVLREGQGHSGEGF